MKLIKIVLTLKFHLHRHSLNTPVQDQFCKITFIPYQPLKDLTKMAEVEADWFALLKLGKKKEKKVVFVNNSGTLE